MFQSQLPLQGGGKFGAARSILTEGEETQRVRAASRSVLTEGPGQNRTGSIEAWPLAVGRQDLDSSRGTQTQSGKLPHPGN